jgi:L-lysine 2,3-aminomutase
MRGINDDATTMKALCEGLVRMRVRPYYCYQAQFLEGTGHFRVPVERGLEIFRELRGGRADSRSRRTCSTPLTARSRSATRT